MQKFFFVPKKRDRLDEALRKVPLFRGLTKRQIEKLARKSYVRYYKEGESVFFKSEPAYGLFIVLRGQVNVGDSTRHITTCRPFHAFGEFALLKDATRAADAVTKGETALAYLFKEDLHKLFMGDPRMCATIYQNLLTSAVDTLKRSS
ncbi:cyclic nucleotide-binding domain-containing protein [Candidatus Woesearchaeota archaeon]|nr:cyclic nucleotide-binding domain-containing protein [Candidatus Woesearchaeota archaeon]